MQSDPDKLLQKSSKLIHLADQKVAAHTMRDDGDWVLHSVMLEGYEVPFKFRRQQKYKSLKGARVNMTYYTDKEEVAGMAFEIMRVVRIKRS